MLWLYSYDRILRYGTVMAIDSGMLRYGRNLKTRLRSIPTVPTCTLKVDPLSICHLERSPDIHGQGTAQGTCRVGLCYKPEPTSRDKKKFHQLSWSNSSWQNYPGTKFSPEIKKDSQT